MKGDAMSSAAKRQCRCHESTAALPAGEHHLYCPVVARAALASPGVTDADAATPRATEAARTTPPEGLERVRCSRCGKSVSSPVPAGTIVRAFVECPECIEAPRATEAAPSPDATEPDAASLDDALESLGVKVGTLSIIGAKSGHVTLEALADGMADYMRIVRVEVARLREGVQPSQPPRGAAGTWWPTCPVCDGRGELREAVQAWDVPGAPVPPCPHCEDGRINLEEIIARIPMEQWNRREARTVSPERERLDLTDLRGELWKDRRLSEACGADLVPDAVVDRVVEIVADWARSLAGAATDADQPPAGTRIEALLEIVGDEVDPASEIKRLAGDCYAAAMSALEEGAKLRHQVSEGETPDEEVNATLAAAREWDGTSHDMRKIELLLRLHGGAAAEGVSE